ncbi:MAG: hypothetical protein RR444_10090 [Oscillospiraceae bacterium]
MTSLERMLALLSQTHLYDLRDSSATTIELKQHASYFDHLSTEIDILLNNCFVETISPAGYRSYMKLYSLPEEIDWDLMKDIVNRRLAITNRDFTIEGVKRCLASGGLTVTLTENFLLNQVTISILSDSGILGAMEEKVAFIKNCIPCHVEPIII